MGYTHYWRRVRKFDSEWYEKVVTDFKEVMKHLSPFVPLAGGSGEGAAEITIENIRFNGVEKCGHADRNLGIAWADENARGVALVVERYAEIPTQTLITMLCGQDENLAVNDSDVSGTWFAGVTLKQRSCSGDCSHETFHLPLEMEKNNWQKPIGEISHYDQYGEPVCNDKAEVGLYFDCCKTAYKPYDLAVIICLIIAKHHLKEAILPSSDGRINNWQDGMLICQKILGYGLDFELRN
ncbi:MAG: hypothetical protein Q7T18_08570 [Sedimentisphaerales bacterium]|nr:hypothetical protein [Sedimentisphaerales bacterium]